MPETWRPIPGYQWWQASDRGRIRSVAHQTMTLRWVGGRVLKQRRDADGYWRVKIAGRQELVHRLVLLAWAGPCPEGMEGCHGELGKDVNTPGNLEWKTHRANEWDKRRGWNRTTEVAPPDPLVTPVADDVQ